MSLKAETGLRYDVSIHMPTEDQIIESCKKGGKRDFAKLYDAYAEPVYRFLFYRTFDRALAEDLTSDTFLKALDKIGSFDSRKGNFSSWVYRIARNTLIDHVRTNRSEVDIEEVFDIGAEEDHAKDMDNREAARKVLRHLKTFSPDQQEIVKLRVWDELSYREIAEIVGKSEGACKVAFSRALARLQKEVTLPVLLAGLGFLSEIISKKL